MKMYEDNSFQSVTYLRAKSKTVRDILLIVLICVFSLSFAIIIFYSTALSGTINKVIGANEKKINDYFANNPADNPDIVVADILALKENVDLFFYIYDNKKLIGHSKNLYFDQDTPLISERELGRIVYFKSNDNSFWGKVIYFKNYRIDMAICIDTRVNDLIDFCMVVVGCSIIFCIIVWYVTKKIANSVLEPLRKSIHQQVLLAQDASHSLKTPIAVIKGEMELLAIKPEEKIKNHFEEDNQRVYCC